MRRRMAQILHICHVFLQVFHGVDVQFCGAIGPLYRQSKKAKASTSKHKHRARAQAHTPRPGRNDDVSQGRHALHAPT